jgi:hypothetical protein
MTFAPRTIQQQVTAVEREIAMRRSLFPKRVAEGRMTQAFADAEIANMVAVLDTLKRVRDQLGHGPFARLERGYSLGWTVDKAQLGLVESRYTVRLLDEQREAVAEGVAPVLSDAVWSALDNHGKGVRPAAGAIIREPCPDHGGTCVRERALMPGEAVPDGATVIEP